VQKIIEIGPIDSVVASEFGLIANFAYRPLQPATNILLGKHPLDHSAPKPSNSRQALSIMEDIASKQARRNEIVRADYRGGAARMFKTIFSSAGQGLAAAVAVGLAAWLEQTSRAPFQWRP
jgi:hypothetical protein